MASIPYAAACQTSFEAPCHRDQIADRTGRMIQMVEQTVVGYEPFFDVRLLVFPEFAHAVPIHDSIKRLRRELAVELPNEHITAYENNCLKDLGGKSASAPGSRVQVGPILLPIWLNVFLSACWFSTQCVWPYPMGGRAKW